MDLDFCTDCKQSTVVAVDHRSGDTICVDCGLVLESRYIDATAEWRTFSDADGDPNRCGDASDPLLETGDPAAITISAVNAKNSDAVPRRFLAAGTAAEKSVKHAFQVLDQMAARLGLVRVITDHAKQLFKSAHDHKRPNSRTCNAVVAACLFLACKEKGVPRDLREISEGSNGCSMKEINRAKNYVAKIVELDNNKVIKAGDISRRCCSGLGMNNDMIKAVSETLRNLEEQEIDIKRHHNSVLAAVMYLIVQLFNVKASLSDLSQAAGCKVSTTKKAYKDLYPYSSTIVPSKFKFEVSNKLCAP